MEILADLWFLLLIGLLPTFLSIVLGSYWLKFERFPWEKAKEIESNQDKRLYKVAEAGKEN